MKFVDVFLPLAGFPEGLRYRHFGVVNVVESPRGALTIAERHEGQTGLGIVKAVQTTYKPKRWTRWEWNDGP